jgi:serine phosphatase RsbU (regulator of sigma subunit)
VKPLVKSFTGLIGLALFGYLFVFYAAEATKVWNAQRSGTFQSGLRRLNDSTFVFEQVDLRDFPEPPVPRAGDTLVTVADSAATRDVVTRHLNSPLPPGTEVPYSFRQDGQELHGYMRLTLLDAQEVLLIWVLQAVRFLTTLLFVSVALWAFFKRPDSAGVRTLALFSFAMAAFLMAAVQVMGDTFATFRIPFVEVIHEILEDFSIFFGAFWLNLALLFPRPHRFLRKRPAPAHLLCYLPVLLILAVYGVRRMFGHAAGADFGHWIMAVLALQIIVGLLILATRNVRQDDRVEKRQIRLVLWGTGSALVALVALIVAFWIFRSWFAAASARGLIAVNIAFLVLLLSPVSFAYAFNRYRLLEVEGRLRRGTRYMAAFVAVMGGIAGFGFLIGLILRRFLGESAGNLALFLSVLAAFGVLPLLRGAQRFLERTFYPERRRLRQLIHDFLSTAASLADKHAFWTQLEERLRDGLRVEGVYPLLRSPADGRFRLRDHQATPFGAQSELAARLERDPRPLMLDEVVASRVVRLSAEEAEWIARHRVALVLPLIAHGRLIGLLGLGMKTEQEDYAPEELRILDSLTAQVAVSAENIRLLEENVDKRRLEEQLQMARRIQRGFLPRQIPPTAGLEVAASTRFCLEVAGDYYDIIPLSGGETVLAVGDVSGKGAGAALLMANLQASLRTAVGVGAPLSEVVGRINELIVGNTPPEDYITFFVAVFDPQHRRLAYVNAGHNPPLLRRAGGRIEALDMGGLILGFMNEVRYEQASVALAPGDLLLLYTDGVSEAMNAAEEEFGEARLRAFLERPNGLPPADALTLLEREVLQFHGHGALEDDFTLLLARVR